MEEELLTREEVAKFLKVSETTVYRLVKNKQLPAIKVGKGKTFVRFRKRDVLAFLEKYSTLKEEE
jgi:excisionase family DNA binding protein